MNANMEMLAGYADPDADLCIRIMSLCCSLGVSESSVGKTVKCVASAIVNILCGRFIAFSTG